MTQAKNLLVSSEWLANHLDDEQVRIFDCSVGYDFSPTTGLKMRSARAEYEVEHIPGAAFLDTYTDLSTHDEAMFTRLVPEKLAETVATAGVGDEHHIVLYSKQEISWATRVWWMLRANGFKNISVLDGGLPKWKTEGRAVISGVEAYPETTHTAQPDEAFWADKEEVLREIDNGSVCTINTLGREDYLGEVNEDWRWKTYGRKGRIKGSVNLPSVNLTGEDGTFLAPDALREAFQDIGALDKERVICYCGGGIAATTNAFALYMLGHPSVAVYDGSLHEWGNDETLPMEVGENITQPTI